MFTLSYAHNALTGTENWLFKRLNACIFRGAHTLHLPATNDSPLLLFKNLGVKELFALMP